MGSSAIAHCSACGYQSGLLMTGGGIRNFRVFDARPANCARCQTITWANVKAQPLACQKCGGTEVILLANNGVSSCPKCGERHLELRDGGLLWD